MKPRTKYLVLGFFSAAMAAGIIAEQNRPRADPAMAARGALALTAAKAIKKAAKDPGSIDFVAMDVNSDATAACAEYRGRNSFNAKIKEFTVFVNGAGVTGDPKVWNKHCTRGMHDQMPLVR